MHATFDEERAVSKSEQRDVIAKGRDYERRGHFRAALHAYGRAGAHGLADALRLRLAGRFAPAR